MPRLALNRKDTREDTMVDRLAEGTSNANLARWYPPKACVWRYRDRRPHAVVVITFLRNHMASQSHGVNSHMAS
jgi:hypothetical protein